MCYAHTKCVRIWRYDNNAPLATRVMQKNVLYVSSMYMVFIWSNYDVILSDVVDIGAVYMEMQQSWLKGFITTRAVCLGVC